jgi:hypothetical protein
LDNNSKEIRMESIEEKYKRLLQPSDDLVRDIASLDGDIMILGVGGKMGPALGKACKAGN